MMVDTGKQDLSWCDVAPGPVYTILLLAGVVSILTNPAVLQDYHFLLHVEESDMIHAEYQGIGIIFVDLGKTILTAMLTGFFAYLYTKTKSKIFYLLAIGTVVILCMGILFGYSRHSILMPAVAGVYLLIRLFPREKYFTLVLLSVALFGAIFLVTLLKNTQYKAEMDSFYYDMYFSGPNNLGGAVVASERFDEEITEKTFANDLFYNVPLLGHFFEPDDRTTTYFNVAMGMKVNILSTVGQTKMFFGDFLCFVPEILYLLLLSQCDLWIVKTKRIYYMFSLMFITCRIGFCFYQNMSIMTGFLLGNALFYVLLMCFDHITSFLFQKSQRKIITK